MRIVVWMLAGLAVAMGIALVPFAGASSLAEAFMLAVYAGIGALLATRRPRNAIGWLLLCVALAFGSMLFCEQLGLELAGQAAGAWLLWYANSAWILAITPMLVFIPLLFPAGRPRGRLLWVAV